MYISLVDIHGYTKKKTGQNRNVVNRKLSWFLCEMMVPTGAPKTAKWPGVKNWALCFVKNYKFSRISRYIKDIYGYLTTMIQISSIWKKIVQCVSLRLFELRLSLVGHLQHEVHCPLVGGTHGFMEFHGNAGGVPKWSYPKSLYVIGFNTKSWSSITWSGGTPSAWGDRDMRSCRGQNLKKTS